MVEGLKNGIVRGVQLQCVIWTRRGTFYFVYTVYAEREIVKRVCKLNHLSSETDFASKSYKLRQKKYAGRSSTIFQK